MEEKYNKNHLEYFVVVEEKQRYIDEKERRGGNEKSVNPEINARDREQRRIEIPYKIDVCETERSGGWRYHLK
jgi:hypothetical protein